MVGKQSIPLESSHDAIQKIILGEIIGATCLSHPVDGCKDCSMCPFVVTTLNGEGEKKILGRTKCSKDTCNPIWCVDQRCLFLLNCSDTILEHENSYRIQFDVRNKETFSIKSDPLSCILIGSAKISLRDILYICEKMPEERIELTLDQSMQAKKENLEIDAKSFLRNRSDKNKPIDDARSNDTNKLAIRFRFATTLDQQFMHELKQKNNSPRFQNLSSFWNKYYSSDGLNIQQYKDEVGDESQLITEVDQKVIGLQEVMNMISILCKKNVQKGDDGVYRERVQPYPDSCRPKETTFLSHNEMESEMYKPSTSWTEYGENTKNSLGAVFVEILQCEGLPNMDSGEALGNKTDAFVCVICEESIAQTNVIDDRLSPMWMPWTKRSFCFNVKHVFSQLFISVNDFDIGPSQHDGIGRIVVNLSHFESDVCYTLKYKLHSAANLVDRESVGTISIRLRKLVTNEKALLLSAMNPIPRLHVNMRSHRTLSVANFTLHGSHDEDFYDIQLLRSYINEILEMKRFLLYSFGDAISSLIMWRGQVKIGGENLPLHSLLAFFGGIHLVERPHLWPGISFFIVAWAMFASMTNRQQHPSKWHQTTSFFSSLSKLLMNGKSSLGKNKKVIDPMDNFDEILKFESNWAHRISTDLDAAWKKWEMELEMQKIGNEDLNTEERKATTDPLAIALASLKPRLFPIQTRLKGYCQVLRRLKSITSWEEDILSFWFTLTCIMIGITLLLLPTIFILHWASRLFVWIILGPWCRIYYEICVFKDDNPMNLQNDDARSRHQHDTINEIKLRLKKKGRVARSRGEEALKMKEFRKLYFGDFIAKVPRMYISRHYDYPLAESKAKHTSLCSHHPIPPKNFEVRNIQRTQTLIGKMIPLREEENSMIHVSNHGLRRKGLIDDDNGEIQSAECKSFFDGDMSSPEFFLREKIISSSNVSKERRVCGEGQNGIMDENEEGVEVVLTTVK